VTMTETKTNETYVLGSSEQEHQRLIRQAGIYSTFTERLFRDAGVAAGHRVLDLGSGLGDVTMLASRLVGPSGTVLGVDSDPRTLAKAKTRVAESGLRNVNFVESDLTSMENVEPFDAIVGRFILEFLPSPGVVVSSICEKLKPGGVLAIQDACWGPFLQLCSHLPLRSKCADLIYQCFQRSGANMDMELVLCQTFQEAGLAPPSMRVEIAIGEEPDIRNYVCDVFYSLYPVCSSKKFLPKL